MKEFSKKILLWFSMLGFVMIFSSFNQSTRLNYYVPQHVDIGPEILDQQNINYHWFFIQLRTDEKAKKFYIVGTGSKLETGPITIFRQRVWWGINRKQLAIGPFLSEEEAEFARMHYRANKERIPTLEKPVSTQVHWFLLSVREIKRANALKFMRMPARTASGTIEEFIDALYEGLSFEYVCVGAFWSYNHAEEAKEIYRENE